MAAKRKPRAPRGDTKSSVGGKMASIFGKTTKKPEPDDLPAMTPPRKVEKSIGPTVAPMQRGARMKRLSGKII